MRLAASASEFIFVPLYSLAHNREFNTLRMEQGIAAASAPRLRLFAKTTDPAFVANRWLDAHQQLYTRTAV